MTPQEREVRDLRARVAQLEEKLEEERAANRDLRVGADAQLIADLHGALPGLTYVNAWLLAALYRGRGRVLPISRLLEELPGNNPDRSAINTVSVRICQVRKVVGREAIKNHWGVGYSLTPVGIAKCDAALGRETQ